jgi:hypothetical protein
LFYLSYLPTKKNLWQCFGCGAAKDPIRFVEKFDQVDIKEAVKRQTGNGFKRTKAAKTDPPKPLSAKLKKLLDRVIEFYLTAFGEDPRAAQYLEKRGITDKSLCSSRKIGFANGTLLNTLPDQGDILASLKTWECSRTRAASCFTVASPSRCLTQAAIRPGFTAAASIRCPPVRTAPTISICPDHGLACSIVRRPGLTNRSF